MGTAMDIRGINHLALVCSDMSRTVAFYEGVLGFKLNKTVELPHGHGQHFFFDIGGGNSLAFFWFPQAPEAVPGVSQPAHRVGEGDIASAVGSMNHVAFDVPADKIDEYRQRLLDAGVECSVVVNHDDSDATVSREMHPGVFVRSVYFQDPDGISLELAAWTRVFDESDVRHAPSSVRSVPAPVAAGV